MQPLDVHGARGAWALPIDRAAEQQSEEPLALQMIDSVEEGVGEGRSEDDTADPAVQESGNPGSEQVVGAGGEHDGMLADVDTPAPPSS